MGIFFGPRKQPKFNRFPFSRFQIDPAQGSSLVERQRRSKVSSAVPGLGQVNARRFVRAEREPGNHHPLALSDDRRAIDRAGGDTPVVLVNAPGG